MVSLINGSCAKGKTNLIHNTIEGLRKETNVDIYVVDLKGLEFNDYIGSSNIQVLKSLEGFNTLIDNILNEMCLRRSDLMATNCLSITEYNLNIEDKFSTIVVFIDGADFLDFNRKGIVRDIKDKLTSLYSMCKPLGINILMTNQTDKVSRELMCAAYQHIEFPSYFNRYLTDKLNIKDADVCERGNCVFLVESVYTVVKTPLSRYFNRY